PLPHALPLQLLLLRLPDVFSQQQLLLQPQLPAAYVQQQQPVQQNLTPPEQPDGAFLPHYRQL
ncbi:hypothetical protein QIG39_27635, partial [Klebsiella pneumoniae]|nr:hypothetical protein [Klebsiella pneumoniae]